MSRRSSVESCSNGRTDCAAGYRRVPQNAAHVSARRWPHRLFSIGVLSEERASIRETLARDAQRLTRRCAGQTRLAGHLGRYVHAEPWRGVDCRPRASEARHQWVRVATASNDARQRPHAGGSWPLRVSSSQGLRARGGRSRSLQNCPRSVISRVGEELSCCAERLRRAA